MNTPAFPQWLLALGLGAAAAMPGWAAESPASLPDAQVVGTDDVR